MSKIPIILQVIPVILLMTTGPALSSMLLDQPLLWGVTGQYLYMLYEFITGLSRVRSGAKTITPFGLLGGCSSGGFKRRLREEYHISGEGGTDTIRIVPFMRDFVIDFGPADFDPEQRSPRSPAVLSPTQEEDNEYLDVTQIPLMQMDPHTGAEPPRESDIEDINRSYDHHSIEVSDIDQQVAND
ncbi:hypothetical protein ACGC1H_005243 [Rhizoctonia solani]